MWSAPLVWPEEAHEAHLRRAVGRWPVLARDVLAMVAFLLAAATAIGLPVLLVGRALDDGLEGVLGTLSGAVLVLAPLWLGVVFLWRIPGLNAVDRADQAFTETHPDAAFVLTARVPAGSAPSTGEIVRRLPSPYPDGRFPAHLWAVVQHTVLDGSEPVRVVVHDSDGDWAVGDGVHDPNEPGACIATHMHHVLLLDASVAELATMPPGFIAERDEQRDAWSIRPHEYEAD